MQADYEDEHGEKMSLIKLYEDSHKRKDGSFSSTSTADFVDDAKARAETIKMVDSSGSKTSLEIENEAFDAVMYGGEIPNRPVGYSFGVRKTSVFGVNGLIRKEAGYGKGHHARPVEMEDMKEAMSAMNKRNEELHKENSELKSKVQENTNLLRSVLDILRSGKVSTELLEVTQAALSMNKPEDQNGSDAAT